MKKSIVWLASYPKSGNTWLRLFLANYMINARKPVPINEVPRYAIGDAIARTYAMVAGRRVDPNNIRQVLGLRDGVMRGIVGNNADINLVKTHNTRKVAHGVPLIPDQYTRSAIYILRNPLDMVLSYARHHGLSHAQAVQAINHRDNATMGDANNVISFLGPWSTHVESWTGFAPWPRLVLRYEDMLADPAAEFARVVDHVGLPLDQDRLDRAIRFSSFRELRRQEDESGFLERPANSETFFTSGKSGVWKQALDPELAHAIRKAHRATMKRYGYLDE